MTKECRLPIAVACGSFKVLGGRERDCLDISRGLASLGHDVVILTARPPAGLGQGAQALAWELVPWRGWTNHGRLLEFSRGVEEWRARHPVAAVLGFDRISGLDFLYCSDQPWRRPAGVEALLPRHRVHARLEDAVFGPQSRTHIFFLAEPQAANYRRRYALDPARFDVLPPLVRAPAAMARSNGTSREIVRRELSIPRDHSLLVNVAHYGRQKGLDRAIEALSALDRTTLLSVGLRDGGRFAAHARRHGVADRVRFVGYSDNPGRLISAADLMVHPARVDTTGTVIIEGLACGVPVVSSSVCGYSAHVTRSGAGQVISEPFRLDELTEAIRSCLAKGYLEDLRAKARAYARVLEALRGVDGVVRTISERIVTLRSQQRRPGQTCGSP